MAIGTPSTFPITRERQKTGYLLETGGWGTTPAGAPRLLPVETPDLRVVPGRVEDTGPRGRWATTHTTYRTVQEGQASWGGHFYPFLVTPIMGLFMGNEAAISALNVNVTAGNDIVRHQFTVVAQPGSGNSTVDGLSLFLEDEITLFAGDQSYVSGFLVPNFVLSFNKAEGMVAWTADLRGGSQTAQFDVTRTAIAAFSHLNANLLGATDIVTPVQRVPAGFNASLCIHQNDVASGDPNVAGTAATVTTATADLMELTQLEITMDRDLQFSYSGENTRTPADYVLKAPRVTFVATLQFQDYAQYARWLTFDDNSDATSGFGAGLGSAHEQWQLLLMNSDVETIVLPQVGTNGLGDVALEDVAGNSPFNTANDTWLGLDDRYALYLEFPEVEYGEAEPTIARGDDLITIQLTGLALPDPRSASDSVNEVMVMKTYDQLNVLHLV